MCSHYKKPCTVIFTLMAIFITLMILTHLNYFLSYGPVTLSHEKSYYLTFAGESLIVIISTVALIFLVEKENKRLCLPIIVDVGLGFAAILLLSATIMFAEDIPTIVQMKMYVAQTFTKNNENTRLLKRIQQHADNDPGAMKCCGIESPLDYTIKKIVHYPHQHPNVNVISVPDSCCVLVRHGCGRNVTHPDPKDPTIYHEGCLMGGLEPFIGRLDFYTGFFFKNAAYPVGLVLICTLATIAAFNYLYFGHISEFVNMPFTPVKSTSKKEMKRKGTRELNGRGEHPGTSSESMIRGTSISSAGVTTEKEGS